MSIKDVSSAATYQAMPAKRQGISYTVAEKTAERADSVAVSLSLEAMEQAKEQLTPPTKEEQEATERAMLGLRNQSMSRMSSGPDLASDFYGDPATANDAVRFINFFQNSTVSADDMADALHKALTSPADNGDNTTNAMDLALTQGKLNEVVSRYVSADYQDEASAFVSQFINEKGTQADQVTKVALSQATKLAQSLGNREQAQHHQDEITQLTEGTHVSQVTRNEMLDLTAKTVDTQADSDAWFSTMNTWVEENRSLPYILDIEKNHISALKDQWQTFMSSLKSES
jgi:hypothetical protein